MNKIDKAVAGLAGWFNERAPGFIPAYKKPAFS